MAYFKTNISKTFKKILIYISFMVIILVLFLSVILYRRYQKVGLEQVYENNEKMIVQLSYNMSYFDDIVRNFALNEFFNPNNQQLMYNTKNDYFFVQRNINLFQKSIQNNSIFHSALIYNKSINETYSTYSNGFNTMENSKELISKYKSVPLLKPIPRILPEDIYGIGTEKVFTYLMYDNIDDDGMIEGGILIINVKIDWLLNTLKKHVGDNSNIFIIDSSGHVLLDAKENYKMFDSLHESYWNNINPLDEKGESKVIKTSDAKQVLTYKRIDETDWLLVKVEPYEEVFTYIIQVKNETLVATVCCIIIAIILSILISKVIYKPFGNVVKQIELYFGDNNLNKKYQDDADYISEAFNKSTKQLKEFERYKRSTQDIIKENTLKSLLVENNAVKHQNFKNMELIKSLSKDLQYIIVIINIDYYKKYKQLKQKEKEFIKFVITNISNELFGNQFEYHRAYIGKGQHVYMITADNYDDNQILMLRNIITNIQNTFSKITDFTLSIIISDLICNINDIYKKYQITNEASEYRMIYGYNSIIKYSQVKYKINHKHLEYPNEIETKILENLKLGKRDIIKQLLEEFFEIILQNSVENIRLSILQLSMAINKLIKKIGLIKDNIDFGLNYNDIMQVETISEVKDIYYDVFDKIFEASNNLKNNNHYILIKSIKEYIGREFSKENTSLQLIADEFKMSSVYLGQIFKDSEYISISEYINKVRLNKATEMLLGTNYSVKYIIEAVGYCNESNFYKLFKKEYGLTPNNYRKKAVMEKLN